MKTTEARKIAEPSHWFATSAFGWSRADSKEEAIRKLVERFRSDVAQITKAQIKKGEPGMYFWACRVLGQSLADASYRIEMFAPQGVEIADAEEIAIVKATAKEIRFAPWHDVTAMTIHEGAQ